MRGAPSVRSTMADGVMSQAMESPTEAPKDGARADFGDDQGCLSPAGRGRQPRVKVQKNLGP